MMTSASSGIGRIFAVLRWVAGAAGLIPVDSSDASFGCFGQMFMRSPSRAKWG
jgi:hypothetical protein